MKNMQRFAGFVCFLFLIAGLAGTVVIAAEPIEGDKQSVGTVLITGSNRGIGLEFVRQYAAAGWQVIATCRNPTEADDLIALAQAYSGIVIASLDVTKPDSIQLLATELKGKEIQLLINNAALLGSLADQMFGKQDYDLASMQYQVNALGPMRVIDAFIDNVRAGGPGKIITLGSVTGSNGSLQPPTDFYSYSASKAALHFLMHNLSLQLKDEGVIVGLINPGLVDTRGLADIKPGDAVPEDFVQIVKLIQAGVIELTSPDVSVREMIKLIDSLTIEQSGVFLNFDGQVLPW